MVPPDSKGKYYSKDSKYTKQKEHREKQIKEEAATTLVEGAWKEVPNKLDQKKPRAIKMGKGAPPRDNLQKESNNTPD